MQRESRRRTGSYRTAPRSDDALAEKPHAVASVKKSWESYSNSDSAACTKHFELRHPGPHEDGSPDACGAELGKHAGRELGKQACRDSVPEIVRLLGSWPARGRLVGGWGMLGRRWSDRSENRGRLFLARTEYVKKAGG